MKKTLKVFIAIILTFFISIALDVKFFAQPTNYYLPDLKNYYDYQIEYILDTASLEWKVGQLFMPAVYPNDQKSIQQIENYIKKYHIGGVIFFKASKEQIKNLTKKFQQLADFPMFMAIDAEWGLAMRLNDVKRFPFAMTLGAISDNRLIYKMGYTIGLQMKALGLNVNFAPVVDININPKNPVIGVRSFGQNPKNVAIKGITYALGLQDAGILAVAKHFPGHGDTDKDSHKELPEINHTYKRLDSIELYPFKQLIKAGVKGVMIAHLYVPAIEDLPNTPATLSYRVVNGLLRDSLNFGGVVFSDALIMKGVSKYFGPGEAEIRALRAGIDVLLMPQNLPLAYQKLINAFKYGELDSAILDNAVRRILITKKLLGIWKPFNNSYPNFDFNADSVDYLIQQLYQNAITIVKNQNQILPIKHLENKKIAAVAIGAPNDNTFHKYLKFYANIQTFTLPKNAKYQQFTDLREKLKNFDLVIVSFHKPKYFDVKTYGIPENGIWFVAHLAEKQNVILTLFAPPYALNRFKNLSKINSIIIAYEDNFYTQNATAQIIFGGLPAKGKLPVDVANFKNGTGITYPKIRLSYQNPWSLKIDSKYLKTIDTIVQEAIAAHAFPGCQVLAIKDSIVFFYKAYGHYTYHKKKPVDLFTIYDVASITKVAATGLALMKLYEQGKFDINARLKDYLPETIGTDKENIKIIDILTHQARFRSWIPFYLYTYKRGTMKLDPNIYSKKPDSLHSTKVAKNLYILDSYKDTIYKQILESQLIRRKKYLYSDLGFYLLAEIIKKQSGLPLDSFVQTYFYIPLGAYTTTFNPWKKFNINQIAPTEDDNFFRHQLIQGYVHDYGAAMLGGVSGHAGLFSNANDLAKIFQMLLQKGFYADRQYLKPETIELFTTPPFKNNHRALTFDTKSKKHKTLAAASASKQSYGHTGFTGCMVWVDPKYNFIFVFLSNRIYPSIDNKNIYKLKVRSRIHQAFYNAFYQSGIITAEK